MYELTTPQQNIWNLEKYYEGTSISNICGAVFFEKKCDHQLLNQAINKLIENQSGMRLRFREASGTAVQTVASFTEEEFPSVSFENQQAFDQFAREYAMVPFDLIEQPLYRFTIFDLEEKTGILLCTNHLISDAWSVSIMANAVCTYYEELCGNGIAAVQAGDYSAFIAAEQKYLTSTRYEKDKAYWAEQYAVRPEISYIKPNSASVVTPTAKRYTTRVTAELSKKIDRFSKETGISQAVLFEAAMIAYLSRINSENKSISIGVPVLNRSNAAEKQAVGMFISTTPLTVSVSGEDSMNELCQNITAQQFSLFRHQRYPYSHILHDLHEKYDFSGNLYDVIVSFQNAQTETNTKTQWLSNGYCEVGMEFHIDNRDHTDRYTLNIDYQTELFYQDEEIGLLVNRILSIIEQIINHPFVQLKQLDILTDAERQMVITDFNDTAIPFPREKCVHELFREQVERTPEQVAVVFEDQSFTYRQIDEMSNSLAHLLRSRGIGRGDIIPIIAKRSHLILVAMFGILKAGAAYMPVDPTYPKDRMGYMFEDAQAKLALTLGYSGVLDIDSIDLEKVVFNSNITPLDNINEPEDLCYIIFTSGSTGRPKGVMLPHRTVVNYSDNNNNNVVHSIIKPEYHSIVSVTNIVFDIFVTESILSLLNGLTIYFASEDQCFRQAALAKLIQQNHVDVIQTTPTKMRSYILDKDNLDYLKSLKAIVMGGEAFPVDLYGELKQETDAEIFNIYGPAETTVWSTNAKVTSSDITIGRPIANTQVYILDSKQAPLPIGVAGELCISGEGVGKGYLNRPDLTAERFISNPFIPGTTMYRTGDLACWRADGEIEYLGRMDTQVKIRGLRIELGEIESVMAAFEGIQLVAVTDKRDDQGRQYLVGYYTSESQIDEKALRQSLAAKLPKYMVPNYFVHLDEMPMTASGKTDRKKLPVPDLGSIEREYVAPETIQESILCNLLEELFQLEQVGITDNFFEIGGDSLRAIEYVAKAHNDGIFFALQNVFDYPTVRELCTFLMGDERDKVVYEKKQFLKYQPLLDANVVDETFEPQKKSLGNVLLTGATGFLGNHILDQFLKLESGKIYCLVRGGQERLASVLNYYFGDSYLEDLGNRIIAIDGDITKEQLAESMPDDVQTVIHAAATVKHYGSYSYFHGVNVQGTRNVIAYAQQMNARLIHISTLSVSGNSLVDAFDIYRAEEIMDFDETSLYLGQPLDNVYIHSKFEAEMAVLDAALEGLNAKIIRVGNLTNRASDFKFQPNYQSNAFLSRVKAGLEIGCIPDYLLPLYSEYSPIDQTAEGVIKIAQYADTQTVFHLNSNQNLYFNRMVEIVNSLGIKMEILSGEAFNTLLQDLSRDVKTAYIYEAFQNDMDQSGQLVYDTNIHILNDFTIWFLEKLGFQWTKIDRDYVEGYIAYFRNLGYLEV